MDEIRLFQKRMSDNNIDAYIISSNDYHMSEYVNDFFKSIQYLTGFTGSVATLIITLDKAYLWVDERNYVQALQQVIDTNIEIINQGHLDSITTIDFLKKFYDKEINKTLGFDGKLISATRINKLISELPERVKINSNTDIINLMWSKRPELPFSLIYKLSEYFSGRKYVDKLNDVLNEMKNNNADMHIISTLEDQAWLYNLRGNDIQYNPVFLAYTIITPTSTTLFVDNKKIDLTIEKYLTEINVVIKEYNDFYEYLKTIKNKKILIDLNYSNYEIFQILSTRSNEIINKQNPIINLKSIKNKTEIKNIKNAQKKDGAALTKFMCYLKTNYGKAEMTELNLAEHLEYLRKKNKGFIDLSFKTICAFNEHTTMMNYSPTLESNSKVEGNGILLVDSGGHYMDGSTDITRTFVIGKLNDKLKTQFTAVLKSMIALDQAIFLKGTTGANLDILARESLWKLKIDYGCKTGHGIGYLLSIHEGPNNFHWKDKNSVPIMPGMITTCEPGLYLDKYGIRLENELLCVENDTNDFGTFYSFENITYCPIDVDAIKVSLLTKEEREWLINYHKMVYDNIASLLNDDERQWLQEYIQKM